MKNLLFIVFVLSSFQFHNCMAQKDFCDTYTYTLGGKDHKGNLFKDFGWVTKDWVRYTLHKDGTASVYRDGIPQSWQHVHIYIEDTVRYKGKIYVVNEIEENAWNGINWAMSFRLPVNIVTIPYRAFYMCQSIKKIDIPSKVTYIDEWAFYGCGIDTLVIPEGVKIIDNYAFFNCSLINVTLPVSVQEIGKYAFADCREIKSFKVQWKEPLPINENTFKSLPYYSRFPESYNPILYVPKGSLEAYKNAPGWNKFEIIKEFDDTQSTNPQ